MGTHITTKVPNCQVLQDNKLLKSVFKYEKAPLLRGVNNLYL